MASDHANHVIELLSAGEVVLCAPPVNNGDLTQAHAWGDSDFDMVMIEMEHFGFDFPDLQAFLQAMLSRRRIAVEGVRAIVVPVVRIPPPARETSQWIIKQALDLGVYGLVLPHLETPEEALAIVAASRYPERKGRSTGGGQRGYRPHVAARYWGLPAAEYLDRADVWPLAPEGDLLLTGIIESRKGVENLDRILQATNGIGAIWAGQGDLSADMGFLGDDHHPEVEAEMLRILDICKRHGVACAAAAVDREEAVRRAEQGFQIVLARMEPGLAKAVREAAGAAAM